MKKFSVVMTVLAVVSIVSCRSDREIIVSLGAFHTISNDKKANIITIFPKWEDKPRFMEYRRGLDLMPLYRYIGTYNSIKLEFRDGILVDYQIIANMMNERPAYNK